MFSLGDSPTSTPSLDERFAQYFEEVEVYSVGWWNRDEEPQRSRLAACPGLEERLRARAAGARLIPTEWVYRDECGWDSERRELHRELLETVEPEPAEQIADAGPALCFLTLGLPGSGKTRALRRVLHAYLHHHGHPGATGVCDPDELRVRFPEYGDGLGSLIVQDELVRLAYDDEGDPLGEDGPCAQQRTLACCSTGTPQVVDTIGSEHTPPIVTQVAENGGEVHVLVAHVPVEEAVRRTKERALETGRVVPPDLVARCGGRPERALEECLATGHVAAYVVLDTSGSGDEPPRVLETDARETYGQAGGPVAYW